MKISIINLTLLCFVLLACTTLAQDEGAKAGASDNKNTQEVDPGVKRYGVEPPQQTNNQVNDAGKSATQAYTFPDSKQAPNEKKVDAKVAHDKVKPEEKKTQPKIDKSETDTNKEGAKKEQPVSLDDKTVLKDDQQKADNKPQATSNKNIEKIGQPEPENDKVKVEGTKAEHDKADHKDSQEDHKVQHEQQDHGHDDDHAHNDDHDDQADHDAQADHDDDDDKDSQDDHDNQNGHHDQDDHHGDHDDQDDDGDDDDQAANHDQQHIPDGHPVDHDGHQFQGDHHGYTGQVHIQDDQDDDDDDDDSGQHVDQIPQVEPPPPQFHRSGHGPNQPVYEDDDGDTLQDQQDADPDAFMAEWEEHMSDFTPEDLLNLELAPRSSEIIFEMVDHLPSKIRGAYFVSNYNGQTIDFTIVDPERKKIFERLDNTEGFFYFDAEKVGEYTFILGNRRWSEEKTITFALHCGNSSENLLTYKDLDPIGMQMLNATQTLKELQAETMFAFKRQDTHYKTTEQTNERVFSTAIFESLVITVCTLWQVYYIKRILDNRRIV